jgi:hypothetical protein
MGPPVWQQRNGTYLQHEVVAACAATSRLVNHSVLVVPMVVPMVVKAPPLPALERDIQRKVQTIIRSVKKG